MLSASTYTNNFSSTTPTGFVLNGGARPAPNDSLFYPALEDGVLKLTYAENGEMGSAIFDDIDPGVSIGSFTATLKVRIGGGSSTPADGMALFYGSGIDASANFGEEGPDLLVYTSYKGVTISIDTYDNVDADPLNGSGEAPSIDVLVDGVQVLHKMMDVFFLQSDTFIPVTVVLKPNGTISVNYRGTDIYKDAYLPGWAPLTGGQFAIGARTGGLNENNWIDDVSFTTVAAGNPVAPTITQAPASQTVNEHGSATFSVAFDGTPGFSVQWSKNGVDIDGATNTTYALSNISYALNSAEIKAKVTNAQGSVTSAAGIITVNADVVAPTVVSAVGNEQLNAVTVTFSEDVAYVAAVGNYAINNGLAVQSVEVLNTKQVRLTTGSQTPGSVYTLTVNGAKDTATNPNTIATDSTKQFYAFAIAPGFLKFEYWGNIGGVPVSNLLDDPRYIAGTPDQVQFASSFDSRTVFPNDSHENYGARISGWVTPAVTANYYLFLRSDDAAQLFISTDEKPENLGTSPVAEEPGCCNGFREPSADVPQTTPEAITLNAGQRYFILALYKEGGGGDYCQVAWRTDTDTTAAGSLTPIPGFYLSTMADPGASSISFASHPVNSGSTENKTVTFTSAATGEPSPLAFQWQRADAGSTTFANIAGATASSYTTPVLKRANDNGAKYRVVASVPGKSITSSEATLTVEIDSTPPALLGAITGGGYTSVTLSFSEPLNAASASVRANYSISPSITVIAATIVNATTVRLTTAAQAQSTVYSVTATGVLDTAIPANAITAGQNTASFTSWTYVVGAIKWEIYYGIGGTAVNELKSAGKYPLSPDEVRLVAGFDTTQTGGHYGGFADNFGARLSGYVVPTETGDYDFFISSDDASQLYVSTDENPDNLSADPVAEEPGCCNGFLETGNPQTTATPIYMVAGKRYFIEALYKEGGGGDHCRVAWRMVGNATPTGELRPLRGTSVAANVNAATLAAITLPESSATAVGSGDNSKPGFKARIHQLNQQGATALVNTFDRAESQLAGILGANVADLTGTVDGLFLISGTINWNQEMNNGGNSGEAGEFQSINDPSKPDTGIPGIPGTVTDPARSLDNLAGEVVTYAEFPAAGVYTLGVNSDDGFRVTSSVTPPESNGSLVVEAPSTAAKSYYAANGGIDIGGAFKPITAPIRGRLVYVNPATACTPLDPALDLRGNIALIDRGVCTFSGKVQKALEAGAIAAVMVNSRDPGSADGPLPIIMGGSYVDLSAVMISKPDGALIKAAMAGGEQIIVSLTPSTGQSLGSFDNGRGASSSMFVVNVPKPGVYPLRLVWFEGGGGANVEWFSLTASGTLALLNDSGVLGAIKTYQARTVVTVQPTISLTQSASGSSLVYVGILQSSTTVNGTYSDEVGATSPFSVNTAGSPTKFYRTRR